MSARVRTVAVVGRDAALWLTALALRRAFGRTGLAVEAIELPTRLGDGDAYSALPSLAALHGLLAIDEASMLAACSGVPVTGQRFVGWSRSHPDFVHAYDTQRIAFDDVDLLQFWIKAREDGTRVAFEDFSPAASAAKLGRVGGRGDPPGGLRAPARGYHLGAARYAAFVKARALRLGVAHRTARLASVERIGERIMAVRLADGGRVAADLFVDASGADASLINDAPGGAFEPWDAWLGVDRLLTTSAPALRSLPAFAQIAAFSIGWTGLFPLQGRTAVVMAYRSGGLSDEDMLRAAPGLVGLRLEGDASATPFAAGARRSWIGNCVAIGDAAASLEPLDAVALHLTHVGISNLVALFPASADDMPEADAFSAAVARHAAGLRDFQIAHYRLNGRSGEPFWDGARAASGPAGLEARLGLFAARGEVALREDEAFHEQNWAMSLIGHGLVPRGCHPLVGAMPVEERTERMRSLLAAIEQGMRSLPTVEAYLASAGPRATISP